LGRDSVQVIAVLHVILKGLKIRQAMACSLQ